MAQLGYRSTTLSENLWKGYREISFGLKKGKQMSVENAALSSCHSWLKTCIAVTVDGGIVEDLVHEIFFLLHLCEQSPVKLPDARPRFYRTVSGDGF